MNEPDKDKPTAFVEPQQLREFLQGDSKVVIIDVRSAEEFAAGHVEGAINIPADQLTELTAELASGATIVTVCNLGGAQSWNVAEQLRTLEYRNALPLRGGTRGWLNTSGTVADLQASTPTSIPIYLDYNATTPIAPEVADAMLPFLREHFGNPSSSHAYGRFAAQAVAEARNHIAALINAPADGIVFTGCATEANNLALLGVAQALGTSRRHVVVSAIEHPSVIAPARHLEAQGWQLTVVPVDGFGRVSPEAIARALRPDTALVSVMHANNEVGTIQPITEIARITHARGVLLHTDAAQSVGKIVVDVDILGVDLLTVAGHKFYATKGVGALYVRKGTPIRSVLYGADQEHALRPGTENVPAIVGLGVAARLAHERLPVAAPRMSTLRDALHARLAAAIPDVVLNGHPEQRLPNTLHVSFPGVAGRCLLAAVADTVTASVGSACHSGGDTVSGGLAAMGCDAARASGAVRLSLGHDTTAEEIERAAEALISAYQSLMPR